MPKASLMRGIVADKKTIVYGYTGDQMPIYFSQDPVLNARGGGMLGGAAVPGVGADITPECSSGDNFRNQLPCSHSLSPHSFRRWGHT
jgi:hypothetical protein